MMRLVPRFLEQYRSLKLLAPAKVNQPPVRSRSAQQQLNRLRLICETVNAQGPRAIARVEALCEKYLVHNHATFSGISR
jgi:hypothetical protein